MILGFTLWEIARLLIAAAVLAFMLWFCWRCLCALDERAEPDPRPSADPRNQQMARQAVWDYQNRPRNADDEFDDEPGTFARDLIERGKEPQHNGGQ